MLASILVLKSPPIFYHNVVFDLSCILPHHYCMFFSTRILLYWVPSCTSPFHFRIFLKLTVVCALTMLLTHIQRDLFTSADSSQGAVFWFVWDNSSKPGISSVPVTARLLISFLFPIMLSYMNIPLCRKNWGYHLIPQKLN